MFNVTSNSQRMTVDQRSNAQVAESADKWVKTFSDEASAKYASKSVERALTGKELEELVREVFEAVKVRAQETDGVTLSEDLILTVIGNLSGLGPIVKIIADPEVEDIAINLR